MHEFSVTQELIKILIDESKKHNLSTIIKIKVVVGKLTGFFPESIKYYFDILKEEYEILKRSQIFFEQREGTLKCHTCGYIFNDYSSLTFCPKCGGLNLEVLGGDEFYIEYVEGD